MASDIGFLSDELGAHWQRYTVAYTFLNMRSHGADCLQQLLVAQYKDVLVDVCYVSRPYHNRVGMAVYIM
jgi:hypothetical protein